MKYIRNEAGVWELSAYWDYLVANRDAMDPAVFQFASDPDQFKLQAPNGLHDARIASIKVSELYRKSPSDPPLTIEITLLGQNWDRHIVLTYSDVIAYRIETPQEFDAPPLGSTHGDILVHELTVEDGIYTHEYFLSRGGMISIKFRLFKQDIIPVEPSQG